VTPIDLIGERVRQLEEADPKDCSWPTTLSAEGGPMFAISSN
jgi:hypothetical protein